MYYVFESRDRCGSRRRVIYSRLAGALRHACCTHRLPRFTMAPNRFW